MRIAIASGKGGTGKTTVTANLAAHLARAGRPVTALDCDVEEPNLHLTLPARWGEPRTVTLPVPVVDPDACLGRECGTCASLCRFGALAMMTDEPMVFAEMCHGCGLCVMACPAGAISEGGRDIGVVRQGPVPGLDVRVVGGELRVGEAMAPPLIGAVLDEAPDDGLVLVDCPPGTSCPMIKATQNADFAILVTEPTPFGLHDLGLAAEVLRGTGLPFGAVVNRQGLGGAEASDYLTREGIPILGALPHSLEAAQICSEGGLHVGALPGFSELYEGIWTAALRRMGGAR